MSHMGITGYQKLTMVKLPVLQGESLILKDVEYRKPVDINNPCNREQGTGNGEQGLHMVWALDPQMVRATDLYVPYK